jgi:hypothetical protein
MTPGQDVLDNFFIDTLAAAGSTIGNRASVVFFDAKDFSPNACLSPARLTFLLETQYDTFTTAEGNTFPELAKLAQVSQTQFWSSLPFSYFVALNQQDTNPVLLAQALDVIARFFPQNTKLSISIQSLPFDFEFRVMPNVDAIALNLPVLTLLQKQQLPDMLATAHYTYINPKLGDTFYPGACGAPNSLLMVRNFTNTQWQVNDILMFNQESMMPDCDYTEQLAMKTFASYHRHQDMRGPFGRFSFIHPQFGKFANIENFSLIVWDLSDTFELPAEFAQNGKLRGFHMTFVTGTYKQLPPGVFLNAENMYYFRVNNYYGSIPDGFLDALPSTVNAHISGYTHARFGKTVVDNGMSIDNPNLNPYSLRVQCVDSFYFGKSSPILCVPANATANFYSDVSNSVLLANFTLDAFYDYEETYEAYVASGNYSVDVFHPYTEADALHLYTLSRIQSMTTRDCFEYSATSPWSTLNENQTVIMNNVTDGKLYNQFDTLYGSHFELDIENPTFENFEYLTDLMRAGGLVELSVTQSITNISALPSPLNRVHTGLIIKGLPIAQDPADSLQVFFSILLADQSTFFITVLENQHTFEFYVFMQYGLALIMKNCSVEDSYSPLREVFDQYFPLRLLWLENVTQPLTQPISSMYMFPQLQTFVVPNSGFEGTVDADMFDDLVYLKDFNVAGNAMLNGTLSADFMARPFVHVFDISGTDIVVNAVASDPVCRSEPGFTCRLNNVSTMDMGCACVAA